eukprot:CAMPEP_0198128270 /NCGR_PEP_ID=MMETSP1442-20131203/48931_1 /TAXON_ID= /ORGANISM="Craspedostauros australis, Strain CCMP3328" /LENGTH=96 /DNA_ID=CAMNT_0043788401 /DNA_START=1135 /DNA_END=1425 /DNA_ORIENTATION=-
MGWEYITTIRPQDSPQQGPLPLMGAEVSTQYVHLVYSKQSYLNQHGTSMYDLGLRIPCEYDQVLNASERDWTHASPFDVLVPRTKRKRRKQVMGGD